MQKESAHVVLLRNNKTEVLLTERMDMPLWVFPGGQKEDGETIEETALREVKEETSLEVNLNNLVSIYESKDRSLKKYLYEGTIVFGEPTLSDETRNFAWHNLETLPFNMLRFDAQRLKDTVHFDAQQINKGYFIDYKKELVYFSRKPILFAELLLKYFFSKITPS